MTDPDLLEKYWCAQFAMKRSKLTKRVWRGSSLKDVIISVCMEWTSVKVLMRKKNFFFWTLRRGSCMNSCLSVRLSFGASVTSFVGTLSLIFVKTCLSMGKKWAKEPKNNHKLEFSVIFLKFCNDILLKVLAFPDLFCVRGSLKSHCWISHKLVSVR